MVNFLLTIETSISCGTLAVVATIWVVSTTAAIEAGSICAGHGTQLTVLPIVTRRAGTAVRVLHILLGKTEEYT